MDKDLEKKNKTIHFIEKWLIIGIILFVVVQLTALTVINLFIPEGQRVTEEQNDEYQKNYMGHWYNGTFFINMTVKENFESEEKYEEMLDNLHNDKLKNTCYVLGTTCSVIGLVFISIAAYKDYKKKLLEGKCPIYISLAGFFFLLYQIFEAVDLHCDAHTYGRFGSGFLHTATYYPQVFYLCIVPVLLIILGLVLRQKQRKNLKLDTTNNEKIIKTICFLILAGGFGFILYRFGVRVYELFSGSTIRLPFYHYMLDLPKNFASTPNAYTKLVILRFFKDLPTFIASSISIVLFIKIILSSLKGKLLSKENDKRYIIIIISLLVASVVLNVVGVFEVNLLNSEFLYQYKEATYTLAIRSLTEPALFAFFIYVFRHYTEVGYKLNKAK